MTDQPIVGTPYSLRDAGELTDRSDGTTCDAVQVVRDCDVLRTFIGDNARLSATHYIETIIAAQRARQAQRT